MAHPARRGKEMAEHKGADSVSSWGETGRLKSRGKPNRREKATLPGLES